MTKEVLVQFEAATKEFCALAKSLPVALIHQSPSHGEWSRAYVIHHLADCDAHFLVRFLNVLSVDEPAIIPFDEEVLPVALRYEGRSVAVSIGAIEASCGHLVDILKQIGEDDWNRTGVYLEGGEMTLLEILQTTINHRLSHMDQIKR
jgi:uncharacterized damage-inducible protein DinB